MLILTAADIRIALPMKAAIETQKQAYTAVATRTANLPRRTPVTIPDQEAVTLFMPARIENDLGAKIVSVFPKNIAKGLPLIHGLIIMIDSETGQPAALLDATYLTALRTAAGAGAATAILARPDAHIVAIIGSGALARTHILAMCAVRPVSEVRIYSRNPDNVRQLIAEIQPLVEATLTGAASSAEAISTADIVCCVTTSKSPVLAGNLLKPGTHVNGMGAFTLDMLEIDNATIQRAGKVFVDEHQAALAEAGDVVDAIKKGLISESDLIEIGHLFTHSQPGRTSTEAITFFKSCGLAAQDITAAGEVIRRAKQLNLGVEIDL